MYHPPLANRILYTIFVLLYFMLYCSISLQYSTLHNAWTAAHNQVYKVLAASLHKHLAAHWSLHRETQLARLVLELVPWLQSCCSQGGQSQIQTLQHYKWVLEVGNLIPRQYPTPQENCYLRLTRGKCVFDLDYVVTNWWVLKSPSRA